MVKYRLVFFFSEGTPHDKGLSLSENKDLIINLAKDYFDEISWYTPRKLKEMGYDFYIKERNGGLVKNPGM